MLEKLGLNYSPFSSPKKKADGKRGLFASLLVCMKEVRMYWKKSAFDFGGWLACFFSTSLLRAATVSDTLECSGRILLLHIRITKSWKWLGNFPPKHQGEENPGWKSGRQGVTSVCADQELTLRGWLSNCQIRITFHRRQFQVEKGESRDLLQIIIKEDNSTYSLNRSVCIFMVWYFIRCHFLLIAALQIWNC